MERSRKGMAMLMLLAIIEFLRVIILRLLRGYGKPKIIRTDNEAIFTSKQFRLGLKKLGIRHQRTTPGCPWQNGRIERLFGTLKQKLDQWQVAGIAQLNRDLDTFRYWYNHIKPHQNLNGKTPAEAWSGLIHTNNCLKKSAGSRHGMGCCRATT